MGDERSSLQVLLSVLRETQDDVKDLIRSFERLIVTVGDLERAHERLAGKVETLERVSGQSSERAPRRGPAKVAGLGAGAGVVAAALLQLAQALLQHPSPPPAPAPSPPAIVRQVAP